MQRKKKRTTAKYICHSNKTITHEGFDCFKYIFVLSSVARVLYLSSIHHFGCVCVRVAMVFDRYKFAQCIVVSFSRSPSFSFSNRLVAKRWLCTARTATNSAKEQRKKSVVVLQPKNSVRRTSNRLVQCSVINRIKNSFWSEFDWHDITYFFASFFVSSVCLFYSLRSRSKVHHRFERQHTHTHTYGKI